MEKYETAEDLLARAKDFCIICKRDFHETEQETIKRMEISGNFCPNCTAYCQKMASVNKDAGHLLDSSKYSEIIEE